jgi:hypothetical protein
VGEKHSRGYSKKAKSIPQFACKESILSDNQVFIKSLFRETEARESLLLSQKAAACFLLPNGATMLWRGFHESEKTACRRTRLPGIHPWLEVVARKKADPKLLESALVRECNVLIVVASR